MLEHTGQVRRIALTGGIATGKSHVRARFEALGVPTIDADVLAHASVAPGSPALEEIVTRFGPEVLDASGALDRRKLAAIVFASEADRLALEAIVHPRVRQEMEDWFRSLRSVPFGLADIPLLYETGRAHEFDRVIVAACSPAVQLRRLAARDGLSEEEARRRLAAQMPIEEKVRRADYVIRTDGSFEETESQIRSVYSSLMDR